MLEVCVDSLESATNAVNGGADELEVCSALSLGGLTPSKGLVKCVVDMVNKHVQNKASSGQIVLTPKINVMIRCREGYDFCYTREEMDTMLEDIRDFKTMKVDRFVFGCLTEMLTLDEAKCKEVLAAANPKPVTFHRAFDVMDNSVSIESIIGLGFSRLLTSGRRKCAGDHEAVILLKKLLNLYRNEIQIMPGAGIDAGNARIFVDLKCDIVHSSCKESKSTYVLPSIFGAVDVLQHIYVTNEEKVRKLKRVLSGI